MLLLLFWLHILSCSCLFSTTSYKEITVITGNFTIDGKHANIAQYRKDTNSWSTELDSDLLIRGNVPGVITDVAVNRTDPEQNSMFVVGTFDSVRLKPTLRYCGVGEWSGHGLFRMQDGLCPLRGDDSSINVHINNIVLGGDDLFVGGSFKSRVWDGDNYVTLVNVAQYSGTLSTWLPLMGGQIGCRTKKSSGSRKSPNCKARVNSLLFDGDNKVLYLGGTFQILPPSDFNQPIRSHAPSGEVAPKSKGIAMWTAEKGLVSFPGGGLKNPTDSILKIIHEPLTQSIIFVGTFLGIGDLEFCENAALWNSPRKVWICLSGEGTGIMGIAIPTAALLHNNRLYVAGLAEFNSTWIGRSWGAPYAISVLGMEPLLVYLKDDLAQNGYTFNSEKGTKPVLRTAIRPLESSNMAGIVNDVNINLLQPLQYTSNVRSLSSSQVEKKDTSKRSKSTVQIQKMKMKWIWLAQYPGADARIINMIAMHAHFDDFPGGTEEDIFIVGEFESSVVLWRNNTRSARVYSRKKERVGKSGLQLVGDNTDIVGKVTSLVQMSLMVNSQFMDDDDTDSALDEDKDFKQATEFYMDVAVIFILLFGFGALILLKLRQEMLRNNGYVKLSTADDQLLHSSGHNSGHKGYRSYQNGFQSESCMDPSSGLSGESEFGISLLALSGNGSTGRHDELDLDSCFERAMRARHLPIYNSLRLINPKDIVLAKVIGEGSYGRVWCGQYRNNGVAVKEFVFAQAALMGGCSIQRQSLIEEIVGEAGTMFCLRHPKILQIYGCSLTMQAIWIVTELCNIGSLRMLLNNRNVTLNNVQKMSLLLDVADGMLYLHTRTPPLIHRDMKSHNIFIVEQAPGQFVAKIGDWGSARAVALSGDKMMTHGVGTACWLAPEVINFSHYSKDSDVFAFGIVLWEMYTRSEVHEGLSAAQIIAKVANQELRPEVPHTCPWARLMTNCWKQDGGSRPDFHRISTELSKLYSQYSNINTRAGAYAPLTLFVGKDSVNARNNSNPSPSRYLETVIEGDNEEEEELSDCASLKSNNSSSNALPSMHATNTIGTSRPSDSGIALKSVEGEDRRMSSIPKHALDAGAPVIMGVDHGKNNGNESGWKIRSLLAPKPSSTGNIYAHTSSVNDVHDAAYSLSLPKNMAYLPGAQQNRFVMDELALSAPDSSDTFLRDEAHAIAPWNVNVNAISVNTRVDQVIDIANADEHPTSGHVVVDVLKSDTNGVLGDTSQAAVLPSLASSTPLLLLDHLPPQLSTSSPRTGVVSLNLSVSGTSESVVGGRQIGTSGSGDVEHVCRPLETLLSEVHSAAVNTGTPVAAVEVEQCPDEEHLSVGSVLGTSTSLQCDTQNAFDAAGDSAGEDVPLLLADANATIDINSDTHRNAELESAVEEHDSAPCKEVEYINGSRTSYLGDRTVGMFDAVDMQTANSSSSGDTGTSSAGDRVPGVETGSLSDAPLAPQTSRPVPFFYDTVLRSDHIQRKIVHSTHIINDDPDAGGYDTT